MIYALPIYKNKSLIPISYFAEVLWNNDPIEFAYYNPYLSETIYFYVKSHLFATIMNIIYFPAFSEIYLYQ